MHKKTLLATLIFGLLAGQAVAAPYLPLASDTRNGQEQTATNAWLEVDLGAFEHNIQTLKNRLGDKGPQICAIMKADAYGHGIDLLVPSVVKAGISCIGIASNEEARVAREKGFEGRLMRVRAATPDEVEQALPYKMEELVGSLASAQGIADIAQRHNTNIPVHIGLNSAGMSRNGIDLRQADAKADALAMIKLKGITPVGIMTHFPVEEKEDVKMGLAQFKLDYQWLIDAGKLDRSKLTIHAANSFATLEVPEAYFDMVRPGGIIYGDTIPSYTEYKKVMAFKTQVASVNHYPAGNTVGYDRTFTLKRDSLLANLPMGYSDGYRRAMSNKAYVLIHGQKAPVVGKTSMNTTMVDVTDIKGIKPGDEVVLFGRQGDAEVKQSDLEEYNGALLADMYTVWGYTNPKKIKR
ncbi:alanine racemase [Aeromonas taiwanensis]|uniref:Broad specificity amino-acid racemase n=1 Tax=Aeromonas taiwanensis TaxID=633417 RepID=A0A5F0K9J8_9GAMM|nr:alanine racemase [Aeromonas taiwanensis]TFF74831.1 alanine racemase [Aeromonas taiwanensis]TFF75856.1 alanine racemase [Aeromonas taiwanensis]TFF79092.1 alanine racemase [Aeromonas taiwanensis]